jgi:hypothetical protein
MIHPTWTTPLTTPKKLKASSRQADINTRTAQAKVNQPTDCDAGPDEQRHHNTV